MTLRSDDSERTEYTDSSESSSDLWGGIKEGGRRGICSGATFRRTINVMAEFTLRRLKCLLNTNLESSFSFSAGCA